MFLIYILFIFSYIFIVTHPTIYEGKYTLVFYKDLVCFELGISFALLQVRHSVLDEKRLLIKYNWASPFYRARLDFTNVLGISCLQRT